MRNFAAERLPALPSAEGGMTRLAFACALGKGVDVDALLRKAGLSRVQIEDPHVRISVRSQVVFLDLVAKALGDDLFVVNEGFRVTVREGREIDVVLEFVGIPRRLN